MEFNFGKNSKRDRMMRSKSFEMQEVRKIGRKEAGEWRGIPILCMGIIEMSSRLRKGMQRPGKIEDV